MSTNTGSHAQRQCIANTKKGERCRNNISGGKYAAAMRRMNQLHSDEKVELNRLMGAVREFICHSHLENTDNDQLADLTKTWGLSLLKNSGNHVALDLLQLSPCKRNTNKTFFMKLTSPINKNQSSRGTVYAFTLQDVPGVIKIGSSKGSCDDRIRQWRKCYPQLVLQCNEEFAFPQRMEELIHLQMASMRVQMSCSSKTCKSESHDEWFKCEPEEAKRIISGWSKAVTRDLLYDLDTRLLTCHWMTEFKNFPERTRVQLTAESLLESMAQKSELSRYMGQLSINKEATASRAIQQS